MQLSNLHLMTIFYKFPLHATWCYYKPIKLQKCATNTKKLKVLRHLNLKSKLEITWLTDRYETQHEIQREDGQAQQGNVA